MKRYLRPILAIIIFTLMQALSGAIAVIFLIIGNSECRELLNNGDMTAQQYEKYLTGDIISITLIISGLLTVLCLYLLKMLNTKTMYSFVSINWRYALIGLVAAFAGIFASDMLSEWIDLQNLMEDQFLDMSATLIGFISIGVVGPIVEECVFREAVIGNLVREGEKPWIAILFSSICFGLIHANPAQIPFAMVVGIILGIIYVKTGNIVLTSIIHIINNSFAVLQMNMYGDAAKDFSYRNMLGSFDIPLIIILSCISVFLLYKFSKCYDNNTL